MQTRIFVPSLTRSHLSFYPQDLFSSQITNMEIPELLHSQTLPTFFLMFLLVYLFAYFVIFRTWKSPQLRAEASSCVMSMAHGTPAIFMTLHALLHHTLSSHNFAAPNSVLHNRVLEFSTAYFLVDLMHYILLFPHEILFILHHLATLYVLATCRFMVRHGAYGILLLLVLAEVTSGFQNLWSLASLRKADVPAAARLFVFLSPPFYALYSVVRGILGPILVFRMVGFYLNGEANGLIPKWAWVSWMVVIATAILLSIFWISNNWIEWYRDTRCEVQKKVK